MNLEPKAKPVRIRIKSGGEEHFTLESLKRNFAPEDLQPAIMDNRLSRWLRQQNNADLADMIDNELKTIVSDGLSVEDYFSIVAAFFPDVRQNCESLEQLVDYWKDDVKNARNVVNFAVAHSLEVAKNAFSSHRDWKTDNEWIEIFRKYKDDESVLMLLASLYKENHALNEQKECLEKAARFGNEKAREELSTLGWHDLAFEMNPDGRYSDRTISELSHGKYYDKVCSSCLSVWNGIMAADKPVHTLFPNDPTLKIIASIGNLMKSGMSFVGDYCKAFPECQNLILFAAYLAFMNRNQNENADKIRKILLHSNYDLAVMCCRNENRNVFASNGVCISTEYSGKQEILEFALRTYGSKYIVTEGGVPLVCSIIDSKSGDVDGIRKELDRFIDDSYCKVCSKCLWIFKTGVFITAIDQEYALSKLNDYIGEIGSNYADLMYFAGCLALKNNGSDFSGFLSHCNAMYAKCCEASSGKIIAGERCCDLGAATPLDILLFVMKNYDKEIVYQSI